MKFDSPISQWVWIVVVSVIDSTRAEADWVTIILAALGHPTREQTSFLLLDYPGDNQVDPKTFVRAVRDLIDTMPDNPVVISNEAIAFAKMYVTKDQWATPFWRRMPRFCSLVEVAR